jgi:hypothetical protein
VIKSRIAEHKEAEEKRIAAEREQVKPDPKKPETAKKAPDEDFQQVKESRPSDMEIIEAVSQKFRVHEMVALRWILSIDTESVESEMSKEFAA